MWSVRRGLLDKFVRSFEESKERSIRLPWPQWTGPCSSPWCARFGHSVSLHSHSTANLHSEETQNRKDTMLPNLRGRLTLQRGQRQLTVHMSRWHPHRWDLLQWVQKNNVICLLICRLSSLRNQTAASCRAICSVLQFRTSSQQEVATKAKWRFQDFCLMAPQWLAATTSRVSGHLQTIGQYHTRLEKSGVFWQAGLVWSVSPPCDRAPLRYRLFFTFLKGLLAPDHISPAFFSVTSPLCHTLYVQCRNFFSETGTFGGTFLSLECACSSLGKVVASCKAVTVSTVSTVLNN